MKPKVTQKGNTKNKRRNETENNKENESNQKLVLCDQLARLIRKKKEKK